MVLQLEQAEGIRRPVYGVTSLMEIRPWWTISSQILTRALWDPSLRPLAIGACIRRYIRIDFETLSTIEKDKGFLRVVCNLHILNRVSLIQSAGLEPQIPDNALLQLQASNNLTNELRSLLFMILYDRYPLS